MPNGQIWQGRRGWNLVPFLRRSWTNLFLSPLQVFQIIPEKKKETNLNFFIVISWRGEGDK